MLRLESEAERIVGILHDVVEDSTVTFDDLRQMGYSEELITALDCVTRRGSETYEEFIQRSTDNPIARHVKLADLEDNMDLSRIPGDLTESNLARLNRYRWAWRLLRMADALL
jgi:(p)ppGpp synthase/HD superfamily hydrolase